MRYSLLEMVQMILSAMDSDEVNSISDTVESNQVAMLLKGVYYDLATDLNLPEHQSLFELTASGSNARPTLMTLPTNCVRLDWIKYDNKLTADTYHDYKEVTELGFQDFLTLQNTLIGASSGVGQMTFTQNSQSFEVMYRTDKFPTYYTSTDDNTLLFDSYLNTEDTTLQQSKTMCSGNIYPVFTLTDGFAPDLDPTQFSYFLNRAKVRAFAELKQAQNQEAASEARRQKVIIQKRKFSVPTDSYFSQASKFGRK